jgi:hypothetical protein
MASTSSGRVGARKHEARRRHHQRSLTARLVKFEIMGAEKIEREGDISVLRESKGAPFHMLCYAR